MRTRVKSKMKRGFITCLLVLGVVGAACGVDDNVESETQESGSSINFRFLDKNKRGATKITNADSPAFNHLTASNGAATASAGFKPVSVSPNPPPFRYVYNQQYYQPNPYFTYVQIPQAAQIAAQYSFHSNPVAHFLQTPTQIQYVATPTISQIPQIKYHSFATASSTGSETASNSQYPAQSKQPVVSTAAQASSSAATTQSKQVQVPAHSDYQSAQPVYYSQQPVFAYFPQAHPANYVYQHPGANYLLKQQQQQQQIAGIYGGLYTPTQNAQLTYLVPMALTTQFEQDSKTTAAATSNAKPPSEKTLSNSQQSSSSSSFSFGTKA